MEDIRALLALGPGDPELERVDETLTAGYARAMALEGEHWRLERQMGELTHAGDAEALLGLSRRLAAARSELSHLRALLDSLRTRARELRAATA